MPEGSELLSMVTTTAGIYGTAPTCHLSGLARMPTSTVESLDEGHRACSPQPFPFAALERMNMDEGSRSPKPSGSLSLDRCPVIPTSAGTSPWGQPARGLRGDH